MVAATDDWDAAGAQLAQRGGISIGHDLIVSALA
jgi:hypothetical protein